MKLSLLFFLSVLSRSSLAAKASKTSSETSSTRSSEPSATGNAQSGLHAGKDQAVFLFQSSSDCQDVSDDGNPTGQVFAYYVKDPKAMEHNSESGSGSKTHTKTTSSQERETTSNGGHSKERRAHSDFKSGKASETTSGAASAAASASATPAVFFAPAYGIGDCVPFQMDDSKENTKVKRDSNGQILEANSVQISGDYVEKLLSSGKAQFFSDEDCSSEVQTLASGDWEDGKCVNLESGVKAVKVGSGSKSSNTPSKIASNTPSKIASNTPSKIASNTPSKSASQELKFAF